MDVESKQTAQGDGFSMERSPNGGSPHEKGYDREDLGDDASGVTRERAADAVWRGAGLLWQRRRLIAGVTVAAAIASIAVALLLPRWYAAEARVLRSEGGMSLMGMVDRATGGLGSLFGGGGDYVRYLAILTSRSMMERVVEEFDLVEVYELTDEPNAEALAVATLAGNNVAFEVDIEFDYLAVRAFDQDPERAAAMANFIVAELNEENARLSSQSARESRVFIEQRLNEAEADLDSIRSEIQAFQEENGVVQLESQAQAFMTSVASLRANVAEAEVRYQTLAQQYGPENPQVQAARDLLAAARRQVRSALSGSDELLPISMEDLPATSRRYAELMQAQLVQTEVIQTVYPLYEQALFQERSDASAVQVVDPAIPPLLPARPSRRVLVIGVTLSAFLLVCVFVFLHAGLWQRREQIARRLHKASRTYDHPLA